VTSDINNELKEWDCHCRLFYWFGQALIGSGGLLLDTKPIFNTSQAASKIYALKVVKSDLKKSYDFFTLNPMTHSVKKRQYSELWEKPIML